MNTEAKLPAHNIEATKNLTDVVLMLHSIAVARSQDVFSRIRGALVVDSKRLREISAEMDKLSESYNRYLALQREAKAHEDSSNALRALLGPKAFAEAAMTDKSDAVGYEMEIYPTTEELREAAPLWQHVQQYLRFAGEVQVGEVLSFLDWMEIKTSRQAVESAIRVHPRVFAVRKKGREKFISLKGD
jgi:hypothetical protein